MRTPFDSTSHRVYPESPSSPSSVHSGITVNILEGDEGISPIDSLNVLPRFEASQIPLPESHSSIENLPLTEQSAIEQGVFTRGRYASLPLKVTKPISLKKLSSNLIQNFITMDLETISEQINEKNSILSPYLLCWYDGKRDEKHSYLINKNIQITILESY